MPLRVLGVDEGQGQERAAVLRPARDHGQLLEADVARHDLAPPGPDGRRDVPTRRSWRTKSRSCHSIRRSGGVAALRELGHAADELEGPAAEGLLDARAGAEEVGDQREAGPGHVGEEQRGPAGGDHPAVDLGHLQPRVDGHGDGDEVAVAPELVQVRAQVGEGGRVHGGTLTRSRRMVALRFP